MDNIFLFAGIVSFVFLLAKFIEMRFVEKENKPLKYLLRDTLLVYCAILLGFFIHNQLQPVIEGNIISSPSVFTDNPAF